MEKNEGQSGIGHTGYSKYDPSSAPVEKHGGNSADQDGIVSEQSPQSMYGGDAGSLGRSKG